MRILFPLFVLLPILEIYVLLEVGGLIGPLPTVGVILFTAVVGYRLFRAQGMEKLQKMRSTMDGTLQGQSLAMDMAEGVAILLAGVLLLTPGFVTDAFGFACLIPPIRKAMIKWLMVRSVIRPGEHVNYKARHSSSNNSNNSDQNSNKGQNVIEGDYREK